jgi:hypothetical protein
MIQKYTQSGRSVAKKALYQYGSLLWDPGRMWVNKEMGLSSLVASWVPG